MSAPEPTEPNRGNVPAAVKSINWLALTSFLLSLAGLAAGLVALLGAYSASFAYTYQANTTPWSVYWPGLVAAIVATLLGVAARDWANQHPHEKTLRGFALVGLVVGIVGTLLLIFGGALFNTRL